MRISTIGYSMKQGVKNIGRNKLFSIASIATMAACIFLFGLFYSIVVNFNYIVEKAEEGVAITVFFEEDATDEQKEEIGAQLEAADGVVEVNYVSADDAWSAGDLRGCENHGAGKFPGDISWKGSPCGHVSGKRKKRWKRKKSAPSR